MNIFLVLNNENIDNNSKLIKNNGISNLTFLFYLGLLFLPFDNLFFAPSAGWATIAPFFFMFYTLCNFKSCNLKLKVQDLFFLLLFLILGLIQGLVYGTIFGVIETIGTLILGLSFYYSLQIYTKAFGKKSGKKICLFLTIAYSISYIYGIISLLPSQSIDNFFMLIEKRYYPRLHFSFTEPSFISMHLYGVLFPIAIYYNDKKLKILSILFLFTSLIFGESARFYLDTIAVFLLYLTYIMQKKGLKYLLVYIFLVLASIFIFYKLISTLYPRLLSILENGFYSDNSLAARWFRINAIIHGLDLKGCIFGYGLSNTWIPFNNGYSFAYLQYDNNYLDEINMLKNTKVSNFFCMPLRLISEIGLIFFLYIILKLKSKKYWFYFLIIFWLYLQFDAYAFYAVWIYLYIKQDKIKQSQSSL